MQTQNQNQTSVSGATSVTHAAHSVAVPQLPLVPHTVFMLVGPTQSGKSTFAKDVSEVCDSLGLSSVVLSSDHEREDLMNLSGQVSPVYNRYSGLMAAASTQAFTLLMAKFRTYIAYPMNVHIVILDTTGMSAGFREEVRQLTLDAGYKLAVVSFEFKYRSTHADVPDLAEWEKRIVEDSVMRFRTKVLPELSLRNCDYRIRMASREQFGVSLSDDADELDAWLDKVYSPYAQRKVTELEASHHHEQFGADGKSDPVYAIIGDSHECVEELKELIKKVQEVHPNVTFVHCGDYLDKGGDTLAMVDYMTERVAAGDKIVLGNHENYVVKRLQGVVEPNLRVEQDNFQSVAVLLANPDYAKKVLTLYEVSLPFFIGSLYNSAGNMPFIVTHAPCERRYLGKVHDDALRSQRNYRTRDRTVDMKDELEWLYGEAHWDHPLHLFGHVSHMVTDPKAIQYKNKVFLDTAAVYGGRLTAAIVTCGKLTDVIQVPCRKRVESVVSQNFGFRPRKEVPFSLENYDLEHRDFRLMKIMEDKGVKYISGTMAPAPALIRGPAADAVEKVATYEIESLEKGLDFFRNAGVSSVILQPKYMGSRAQLYLFPGAPEKTFMVSRGGWVIKGAEDRTPEEYQAFLLSLYEKFEEILKFKDRKGSAAEGEGNEFIIDGEFLPWHALGKGLIENAFTPYSELVKSELENLLGSPELKSMEGFKGKVDAVRHLTYLNEFQTTLATFAGNGDLDFKPFAILKGWLAEENAGVQFTVLSEDDALILDLTSSDYLAKAQEFFSHVTVDQKMEGVVAKPLDVVNVKAGAQVPPYLKIRSEDYLKLVYGYDYQTPERLPALCAQKRVGGKLNLSIQEYELGMSMLNATGEARTKAVVEMIGKIKQERGLDPRL